MSVEIYEGTYRGHSIYYYQYEAGGVYRVSDISGTFGTYAEAKAAIDEAEGAAPPPDVGDQTSPREGLLEVGSYRGVLLWQDQDTLALIFRVGGIPYIAYAGYPEAQRIIDAVLGAPGPGEEGYVAPEIPEPNMIEIPWPWSWVGGVLNWFKGLWGWAFGGLSGVPAAIGNAVWGIQLAANNAVLSIERAADRIVTPVENIPVSMWDGLIEKMADIFTKSGEESVNRALKALPEALGKSPEWKTEIEATAKPFAEQAVAGLLDAVNPEKYTHSTLSPEEAASQLTLLGAGVAAANIGVWIAHLAAEAATLGQLEAVGQLSNIVINSLGVNALSSRALMIPIEKSILIPAEQHYNSVYTPEIPTYQDLINQVVKEVISIEEFTEKMKLLGYNETWSKRIWDAHFIAPSLGDLLTAWRRGLIDEKELDRLMILVDLDPRYKNIFDTRKYVDPPLNMTRFLFETGNIDKAQVEENVKLQGYRPEHVAAITEYITEFQARLWRRRYITSLARGYELGVYSAADLEREVLAAEYTVDVAKYIVANADVRKKISESKVVKEEPKLLGIGDLKTAYLRNMIDAAKLRVDLSLRGYSYDDVELLIKVLDEQKVVTATGGRKVALSESELIKAWQYSKITEARLRIELSTRGLTMEEIDILEATKLAEWAAGGKTSPEEEVP